MSNVSKVNDPKWNENMEPHSWKGFCFQNLFNKNKKKIIDFSMIIDQSKLWIFYDLNNKNQKINQNQSIIIDMEMFQRLTEYERELFLQKEKKG